MKKIAIVTLSDFNNYGNRLQNYALERIITSQGYDAVSLVDFRPNLLKTLVKMIIKKDGIKFTYKMKNIRRQELLHWMNRSCYKLIIQMLD